jgi:hypothetical protein
MENCSSSVSSSCPPGEAGIGYAPANFVSSASGQTELCRVTYLYCQLDQGAEAPTIVNIAHKPLYLKHFRTALLEAVSVTPALTCGSTHV